MIGFRCTSALVGAALVAFGATSDALAGEMCQQTPPDVVVAAVMASVASASAAATSVSAPIAAASTQRSAPSTASATTARPPG